MEIQESYNDDGDITSKVVKNSGKVKTLSQYAGKTYKNSVKKSTKKGKMSGAKRKEFLERMKAGKAKKAKK